MFDTPYIFTEIFDIFSKHIFQAPAYTIALEVGLALIVVWFVARKSKPRHGKHPHLTEEERIALVDKWVPEPLVGDTPADHPALHPRIVTGKISSRITVDGNDCLNMGTHNYLCLLADKKIEQDAVTSLRKYGVGSCGPRGFYGTVDVHLELEERLARFMEAEECVVYSYGFSTIASAISAYCKRGDIIFADERVNFAIQKGIDASRSQVFYFKHNDPADLERLLKERDRLDKLNPKKAGKTKRFLIAEGIYMNTGEICKLKELVKLRDKYQMRMFLDESISFGTLGANGRGLTEYLGIDRTEVDLISGSLEWSAASIGGFCVGSSFIVEHQRLSGLGYCFSASLPPLLTRAAITALDRFEQEPHIFKQLNEKSIKLHEKLKDIPNMVLGGDPLSPVKHLYLRHQKAAELETNLLKQIVDKCIENKLAIIDAQYLHELEKYTPRPSIRITANRLLSDPDIDFTADVLRRVANQLL